jgi:hypothetical protein
MLFILFEAQPDQRAGPVGYVLADSSEGHWLPAVALQQGVENRCKIRCGVQQRTIEVKQDDAQWS